MSLFESWFLTQNQYFHTMNEVQLTQLWLACQNFLTPVIELPQIFRLRPLLVLLLLSLRVNPNLDLKRAPHQFVNKVPTSRIGKDLHCSTGLRWFTRTKFAGRPWNPNRKITIHKFTSAFLLLDGPAPDRWKIRDLHLRVLSLFGRRCSPDSCRSRFWVC